MVAVTQRRNSNVSRERSRVTADALCPAWRAALDAAELAIEAARISLPVDELAARSARLAAERDSTLALLKALARDQHESDRFVHLTRRRDARRRLGLPRGVDACVFNLEGVLVGPSLRIEEQGVTAYDGSRHYLQTALEAGVHTAAVSASANSRTILERAGLATLIERCVDGNTMLVEHPRGNPAPDTLLAACRQLGLEPHRAAAFEASPAGTAAARAGGFAVVIGVDRTGQASALRAQGADLVVPGLAELLERRLAA